jgi:hypothetical protein
LRIQKVLSSLNLGSIRRARQRQDRSMGLEELLTTGLFLFFATFFFLLFFFTAFFLFATHNSSL